MSIETLLSLAMLQIIVLVPIHLSVPSVGVLQFGSDTFCYTETKNNKSFALTGTVLVPCK